MATKSLCSVPDCGNPHDSRGYCEKHAARFRKHGDPLGGPTERGAPLRFLNDIALPYDGDECLIWPFANSGSGGRVWRDGRLHVVSRLVCEEAHGAPPSPEFQAAHSCGMGHLGCVAKRHLSWKNHTDNQADRIEHGTHNRGERHGMSILTEEDVKAIRKMTAPCKSIAEMYGVSRIAIHDIRARRTWAWLV